MLISQVLNFDCPLNAESLRKAFKKASWATSSASDLFFMYDKAIRYTASSYGPDEFVVPGEDDGDHLRLVPNHGLFALHSLSRVSLRLAINASSEKSPGPKIRIIIDAICFHRVGAGNSEIVTKSVLSGRVRDETALKWRIRR